MRCIIESINELTVLMFSIKYRKFLQMTILIMLIIWRNVTHKKKEIQSQNKDEEVKREQNAERKQEVYNEE